MPPKTPERYYGGQWPFNALLLIEEWTIVKSKYLISFTLFRITIDTNNMVWNTLAAYHDLNQSNQHIIEEWLMLKAYVSIDINQNII